MRVRAYPEAAAERSSLQSWESKSKACLGRQIFVIWRNILCCMGLEAQEVPSVAVKSHSPPRWELETCCAARDKEYHSRQLPSSCVIRALAGNKHAVEYEGKELGTLSAVKNTPC